MQREVRKPILEPGRVAVVQVPDGKTFGKALAHSDLGDSREHHELVHRI